MGIPEDLALSGQWESSLQYDRFPADLHVDNLYSDSKLEAEKVLMIAAEEGVPVSIYLQVISLATPKLDASSPILIATPFIV